MVGALVFGWLSDAQGRRRVLMCSFLGAAIGYSLASLAVGFGSITLLLLSRLPVGLAKQTVTATRAIVSDLTPPSTRSESLARLFAGCSLGYAIGPYIGGLLAERTGATPLPAMVCAMIFVLLMPLVGLLLPETSVESVTSPPSAGTRSKAGDRGTGSATSSNGQRATASERLLLAGCTLPEGALVMFSSTSLALLAQSLGWPPSRLGLYNSLWGVASGVLSLTLWPYLLSSGWLHDVPALHWGSGSLALASAILAWRGSVLALWSVLPLGVLAVGMIRTIPASLLTKAAHPSERGAVLGRLDAAGSLCRVLLPTLAGALSDRYGIWAAFAAQALLCLAGIAVVERWRRTHASSGATARPKRE